MRKLNSENIKYGCHKYFPSQSLQVHDGGLRAIFRKIMFPHKIKKKHKNKLQESKLLKFKTVHIGGNRNKSKVQKSKLQESKKNFLFLKFLERKENKKENKTKHLIS